MCQCMFYTDTHCKHEVAENGQVTVNEKLQDVVTNEKTCAGSLGQGIQSMWCNESLLVRSEVILT